MSETGKSVSFFDISTTRSVLPFFGGGFYLTSPLPLSVGFCLAPPKSLMNRVFFVAL
jgi:hypothetical protein